MIGLQEMKARMEKDEHKDAAKSVMEMLDHGYYDHDEFNLFGKGYLQSEYGIKPVAKDDAHEIQESLKHIPLREFLAKSSTTGIAGAAYLIPTKIYSVLFDAGSEADKVADISMAVLPAEQIGGTTMKVDIIVDDSYMVQPTSSGAQMPTETVQTTQATLDFTNVYSISPRITNDLIEDSQFDIMEAHLRHAGEKCGEKAMDLATLILIAGSDGDGTLNTEAGGADTTTMTDVANAWAANLKDHFLSDTFLCSHHVWMDAVSQDTTYSAYAAGWHDNAVMFRDPRVFTLNTVFSNVTALTHSGSVASGNALEDLKSIVFTKAKSLLTGRKRWMRIENYSDPIRDLVGAAITFRQDSVSVYDDSICLITET